MNLEQFTKALPKAELHLHLAGSVKADTFLKLARKNGVALPKFDKIEDLYRYDNLVDFLQIYDLVARSVVDADDFHLITYEALAHVANAGGRYVEFFFSPQVHQDAGISYQTMFGGLLKAMDDAETDFGLVSRLIPAINRELTIDRSLEFLDLVLPFRSDKVIGIGLDYDEEPFPPAPFKPVYDKARKAGMRLTAHAGEGGPAANVRDALDLLGVERIDHGYRVMEDPKLVARCIAQDVAFTVCPSSTVILTHWRDLTAADHPIRAMLDAGLKLVVDTDDPPMLQTDLAKEYQLLGETMALDRGTLADLALNSLDAAWLDDGTKRDWRALWSAEIDGLLTAPEDPAYSN
ncbi:adenosine deaminase [Mesorhizobium sp. CO1-1-11]|uniref:adenosine deaminase n=1 Tax=Mesorhizobium sp. CO1-1-11 TaxID=2876636 RepID=UPI001CCC9508|nr:adenosine deaminase [Mesorhizobium sp. CO1-1-11]MBZ9727179.1 adenosine deaminase [Mesorhizobium sp. CO1-1-11]